MKAGTWVKLPDGRIGTAVYNGLDGTGIKWGKHNITEDQLSSWIGEPEEDYEWEPDAMLREPEHEKRCCA